MRLEALPAAERATDNALLLDDFIVELPHMADPSLVFEDLIGCENIKTRLAEYQAPPLRDLNPLRAPHTLPLYAPFIRSPYTLP